ncbi:MAG TPA: hypothetical protein DCP28_08165 [Cytophagales bacterium]|nr:hypothetical protein [Cytophagales bacterium]
MDISDLDEGEARKEKARHVAAEFVRYQQLGYILACSSPSDIPKKLSELTKGTPEHDGFLAGLDRYQKEVERQKILKRVLENDLTWKEWRCEMDR